MFNFRRNVLYIRGIRKELFLFWNMSGEAPYLFIRNRGTDKIDNGVFQLYGKLLLQLLLIAGQISYN
jgi:hypothetical protein